MEHEKILEEELDRRSILMNFITARKWLINYQMYYCVILFTHLQNEHILFWYFFLSSPNFFVFCRFWVYFSCSSDVRHVSGIPRSLSLCFSFLHFCPCSQVLGRTCSDTVWWCIVQSLRPSCCEGGSLISTGTAVLTGSSSVLSALLEENVRKAVALHTIASNYPFL